MNQKIQQVLAARPQGAVQLSDFRLEETPTALPKPTNSSEPAALIRVSFAGFNFGWSFTHCWASAISTG